LLSTVTTVTGQVDPGALGLTLPHEHLWLNLVREYRGDGLINDEALVLRELDYYKEIGGRTIVECTSQGLGRDPEVLKRLSEASGVQVVMGCGLYRDPYIDRDWLDRTSTNELADLIVSEIEHGVGTTGIKPGVIGEVGCDRWYISTTEERSLRAAARAQLQTGLTITTHAARWPVGIPQFELLTAEGVDADRIIIGHCDLVSLPGYQRRLAELGAYVQFDTIQGESVYDTELRVGLVLEMINAGFGSRVLLSHDICLRSNFRATGGCGYTYVPTTFAGLLQEAGVSKEQINQFLIDNPRRALTGAI
jgi:predicted metal-dependent phosphotriesterase family hydrolase